jgi:hypothetical protein
MFQHSAQYCYLIVSIGQLLLRINPSSVRTMKTSEIYHVVEELMIFPASKQSKPKLYVAVTCIWILRSCRNGHAA